MDVGRRLRFWLLVGAGVLAVWSVVDARGFRRYARLRRDIASLEQRNQDLAHRNRELLEEIKALRTQPQALERAAREELGFVKPGEVVFHLE